MSEGLESITFNSAMFGECYESLKLAALHVLRSSEAILSDWDTHFAAAVFQQDVDVFLVLEMVIKVHNVFMMQYSVQLDLSVNLAGTKTKGAQLSVDTFLVSGGSDHGCCALTFSRW